jgi:hypothetical protein
MRHKKTVGEWKDDIEIDFYANRFLCKWLYKEHNERVLFFSETGIRILISTTREPATIVCLLWHFESHVCMYYIIRKNFIFKQQDNSHGILENMWSRRLQPLFCHCYLGVSLQHRCSNASCSICYPLKLHSNSCCFFCRTEAAACNLLDHIPWSWGHYELSNKFGTSICFERNYFHPYIGFVVIECGLPLWPNI